MIRAFSCAAGICIIPFVLAGAAETGEKNVTWTGWFSDLKCASARAVAGTFTATNPDCAKSCIKTGISPVFVSEQAKALFIVKDFPSIFDDLGFHVEVQATVNEAARTITIQKVKRLEYEGAACERPKKPSRRQ
jgi:hypothetical protein